MNPLRLSRSLLCACSLGLLLAACSVSVNTTPPEKIVLTPGEPDEQKAALAAAQEIVRLLDANRVEATWDRVGAHVKQSSSKSAWVGTLRAVRASAGGLKSRKPIGGGFTPTLEAGVPAGRYGIVFFNSEFELLTMEEKVVLSFEDGKWRVVGYFLSKKTQVQL